MENTVTTAVADIETDVPVVDASTMTLDEVIAALKANGFTIYG